MQSLKLPLSKKLWKNITYIKSGHLHILTMQHPQLIAGSRYFLALVYMYIDLQFIKWAFQPVVKIKQITANLMFFSNIISFFDYYFYTEKFSDMCQWHFNNFTEVYHPLRHHSTGRVIRAAWLIQFLINRPIVHMVTQSLWLAYANCIVTILWHVYYGSIVVAIY